MSKKAPSYTATLRIFGKTHKATGKNVMEAINKLNPANARGVAVLTVSKGKEKKERILTPTQSTRLFNTAGVVRDIHLKNVSLMFSL